LSGISQANKSLRGVIELPAQPFINKFGDAIIACRTNTHHGSDPNAKHGVDLTPANLHPIADFFEFFGCVRFPSASESAKKTYRLMRSMRRKLLKYKLFNPNEEMVTGVHINGDSDVFDGVIAANPSQS
jgi:hypothetical protein